MLLDLAQLLTQKFSDECSVGDAIRGQDLAEAIPIPYEEPNLSAAKLKRFTASLCH